MLSDYTAKELTHSSLKVCNGTIFFPPLPLYKTLDALEQVKYSSNRESGT